MPLSPSPETREKIHTRQVTCVGYRREDKLWDIEAHLLDTKGYDFMGDDKKHVAAGTPIHDMKIRMTVSNELVVTNIEIIMDSTPFPETCPDIAEQYRKVIGMKISTGWTRSLKEKFDGTNGCTHLTELLGPMATTAYQTIVPYLAREAANRKPSKNRASDSGMDSHGKALLNTCYAFRKDGPVAQHYFPDLATKPEKNTNQETQGDTQEKK